MTTDWTGKGLGVFLIRLMYLYYHQIYPLPDGDTFLQVWHTNVYGESFFKRLGFIAVEVSKNTFVDDTNYLGVLEENLDPILYRKVTSFWDYA